MVETDFQSETLTYLQERNPRFHPKAYVFLMAALGGVIDRLEGPRHISGPELAEGVRVLAMEKFGPLARTVLEYWGVCSTEDLGDVVFALVECGVLLKQDEDSREDFMEVFDFEEAFEQNYPWRPYP